jgi:hyperosmotically inducible periplasmic protein
MKTSMTRIPLAIALSSALAFVAGCTADRDRNVEGQAVVQPADESDAQLPENTVPADPMAQGDATYGDATADAAMDEERRSDQPADDTWITTKVKSSLLADTDVSGLDIDVETVNGVVTLSGEVEQQAQIDRAARIARDIEGVTEVRTTDLVVDAN